MPLSGPSGNCPACTPIGDSRDRPESKRLQMPRPLVTSMSYSTVYLRDWCRKDCRMLLSSAASESLKAILVGKAGRRKAGRRFFGEAYAAAHIEHRDGYYGSFKWLTNPRYADDRPFPKGLTERFKHALRTALWDHFGIEQLERLHRRAKAVEKATGIRPVAPDLWLIDREGNHRFIEVKLPGDRIRPQQIQGMRLIALCLRPTGRLTVELLELRPKKESKARQSDPIGRPSSQRPPTPSSVRRQGKGR